VPGLLCRPGNLLRRHAQEGGPGLPADRDRHLLAERHEFALYLAVEDVEHTRTRTKSPQTSGICERVHRTVLDEFYRVAFRKKLDGGIDDLQADLDAWVAEYNEARLHQGRWCYGKTPMRTFVDSIPLTQEKMLPTA
jgi:transposase InsO family protein